MTIGEPGTGAADSAEGDVAGSREIGGQTPMCWAPIPGGFCKRPAEHLGTHGQTIVQRESELRREARALRWWADRLDVAAAELTMP